MFLNESPKKCVQQIKATVSPPSKDSHCSAAASGDLGKCLEKNWSVTEIRAGPAGRRFHQSLGEPLDINTQ